jgi:hypothetical protein
MNIKRSSQLVVALALSVVALASLIMVLSAQSARAQAGGEIYVDKRLGRADPVVHVGEYLTFTIVVRNDTTFTVTTLPLSDTYNAAVLGYADAVPAPDSVDQGAGQIDWVDLTTFFGDLSPGQQIVVVVGFIAEHPQPAVVNMAEVHDALGSGGVLSDTNSTVTDTESVGGSSPVDKELLAGLIPQAGLPLTFTIVITNDGFTTMTVAPLIDTYDPSWLQFKDAVPPPDLVDAVGGVLTWSDVTLWTGDIPAHGMVSVTTAFTALAAVAGAANSAEVAGARDWYGNDLAGGADQVPITIIEGPTATPAPTPAATATRMPPAATPTQRAPAPVPATATPAPTPVFLPESGQTAGISNNGLLAALLVLGAGGAALVYVRRKKVA